MAMVDAEDLVGKHCDITLEDGKTERMTTVEATRDHMNEAEKNSTLTKFRVSRNRDQCEEILTCDQVMDHISHHEDGEIEWELRKIVAHQGSLNETHPDCKGSTHNVAVQWENGEQSDEPLAIIGADAPVACAVHAKKKGLLDKPGWKRFKRLAKKVGKFFTQANQAKIKQFAKKPKFKCGTEPPKNCADTVGIDEANGDTL